MTDAWHEAQQAIRALRKNGEIRPGLIEAYRALVKIRGKDLPGEVRHEHEWLVHGIDTRSPERVCGEIRDKIAAMTPGQLSEAVRRIVSLHDALQAYQPVVAPTRQKQAACRAMRRKEGKAGLEDQGPAACTDCTQCRLF
ncbi:hypothetical protein [Noviherbaspirillum malthae]|uniref:hypothetical protein n=1 Tax=Noviherbaspirillum malthae TaxID=1260987 RepID=UPI00188EA6CE|nr:hypothetical protein [Noviherbaspirillum malthae]